MRAIHYAFSAVAAVVTIGCGSEPKQPNVLMIVVDDLGWNDLGCMGSSYYETPNVDALAERGVRFTNGYAGCSVSSPSRGSLMTGKSPLHHGITSWIGDPVGDAWRESNHKDILLPSPFRHNLDRGEYGIAQAMKDGGYATYFLGKWHLGEECYPTDFGYDVNIGGWAAGSPGKGGYFSPYANPMLEDGEDGENLSWRLAHEAIGLMKKGSDKPFFMTLCFYAVHGGIETTEERWNHYRDKIEQQGIAEEGFEAGRRLPVRKAQDNPVYAGLIEQMDSAVGDVINYLRESGLDKNTVVIFTSDNGGVVSGDSYSTSLKPLRGGKGTQWEGGIRVPFIICDMRTNEVQRVVDTPVTGMDIYPTVLDLASLEHHPEQHIDGVSLMRILSGEEIAPRQLFWHYPHYGNQGGEPSSTLRDGDWKLIHYYEDGRDELYNLADDLSEQHDLASVETERTAAMRASLDKILKEGNAAIPQLDTTYTAEEQAEWRSERYTKMKAAQERIRAAMYRPDWRPNKDWWGSQPSVVD